MTVDKFTEEARKLAEIIKKGNHVKNRDPVAYNLLQNKGFIINNIDITLICEKPKINKFRVKIKENISNILKIKLDIINIKATTTERLGFLGREEGIACQVITTVARYE